MLRRRLLNSRRQQRSKQRTDQERKNANNDKREQNNNSKKTKTENVKSKSKNKETLPPFSPSKTSNVNSPDNNPNEYYSGNNRERFGNDETITPVSRISNIDSRKVMPPLPVPKSNNRNYDNFINSGSNSESYKSQDNKRRKESRTSKHREHQNTRRNRDHRRSRRNKEISNRRSRRARTPSPVPLSVYSNSPSLNSEIYSDSEVKSASSFNSKSNPYQNPADLDDSESVSEFEDNEFKQINETNEETNEGLVEEDSDDNDVNTDMRASSPFTPNLTSNTLINKNNIRATSPTLGFIPELTLDNKPVNISLSQDAINKYGTPSVPSLSGKKSNKPKVKRELQVPKLPNNLVGNNNTNLADNRTSLNTEKTVESKLRMLQMNPLTRIVVKSRKKNSNGSKNTVKAYYMKASTRRGYTFYIQLDTDDNVMSKTKNIDTVKSKRSRLISPSLRSGTYDIVKLIGACGVAFENDSEICTMTRSDDDYKPKELVLSTNIKNENENFITYPVVRLSQLLTTPIETEKVIEETVRELKNIEYGNCQETITNVVETTNELNLEIEELNNTMTNFFSNLGQHISEAEGHVSTNHVNEKSSVRLRNLYDIMTQALSLCKINDSIVENLKKAVTKSKDLTKALSDFNNDL